MSRPLPRRKREIIEVLHALGRATAHEVRERLADAPSYSATRALLAQLEQSGHVRHEEEGLRYVYFAVESKEQARKGALKHLLDVFFGGSAEQAVAALLDSNAKKLSTAELDRLSTLITQAKKKGR